MLESLVLNGALFYTVSQKFCPMIFDKTLLETVIPQHNIGQNY